MRISKSARGLQDLFQEAPPPPPGGGGGREGGREGKRWRERERERVQIQLASKAYEDGVHVPNLMEVCQQAARHSLLNHVPHDQHAETEHRATHVSSWRPLMLLERAALTPGMRDPPPSSSTAPSWSGPSWFRCRSCDSGAATFSKKGPARASKSAREMLLRKSLPPCSSSTLIRASEFALSTAFSRFTCPPIHSEILWSLIMHTASNLAVLPNFIVQYDGIVQLREGRLSRLSQACQSQTRS